MGGKKQKTLYEMVVTVQLHLNKRENSMRSVGHDEFSLILFLHLELQTVVPLHAEKLSDIFDTLNEQLLNLISVSFLIYYK